MTPVISKWNQAKYLKTQWHEVVSCTTVTEHAYCITNKQKISRFRLGFIRRYCILKVCYSGLIKRSIKMTNPRFSKHCTESRQEFYFFRIPWCIFISMLTDTGWYAATIEEKKVIKKIKKKY